MEQQFKTLKVRDWQPCDRTAVADLIQSVLREYDLPWQPQTTDRDVLEVEKFYLSQGGQFWVVEQENQIVGTAAFHPIERGQTSVEIRKMYLRPGVRGQGLGTWLLAQLEQEIRAQGFTQIWIETATCLATAILLYERSGYEPATGVETPRCDRIYCKQLK